MYNQTQRPPEGFFANITQILILHHGPIECKLVCTISN